MGAQKFGRQLAGRGLERFREPGKKQRRMWAGIMVKRDGTRTSDV
jgi:hypothetical protein